MLEAKEVDVHVRAEFVAHVFPSNWPWALFAGVEECAQVLEDLPVDELKENHWEQCPRTHPDHGRFCKGHKGI
jgi:hypothetical protein